MVLFSKGKQYSIIKFQQGSILLQHRSSKKVYQYLQRRQQIMQSNITHPILIKPLIYNNGLLYIKGKSSLQSQLQVRKRGYEIIHFQQQQIINTFMPILQCLNHLHKNDSIHGYVHPTNIIITSNNQIKLKDGLSYMPDNLYYFNKQYNQITKDDDVTAWGHIIIQCATLRKSNKLYTINQIQNLIQSLIFKYTKGFIFALIIILRKNTQKYSLIKKYFQNQQDVLEDSQLNYLYDLVKNNKQKKKNAMTSNENIIPNTPKPNICLIESPIKNKNINNIQLNLTLKKVKEDNENKKINNEQTKKKQVQKINKIIQRSNQFVNQLLTRKNNQQILKKITPKHNINLSTYGQSKKIIKQSLFQTVSPSKRLKSFSRKK